MGKLCGNSAAYSEPTELNSVTPVVSYSLTLPSVGGIVISLSCLRSIVTYPIIISTGNTYSTLIWAWYSGRIEFFWFHPLGLSEKLFWGFWFPSTNGSYRKSLNVTMLNFMWQSSQVNFEFTLNWKFGLTCTYMKLEIVTHSVGIDYEALSDVWTPP